MLVDPNSMYVGLNTAMTSTIAAVSSLLFGRLESSHNRRFRMGNKWVLTVGTLSYLAIALQFIAFPDGSDWNRVTLLSTYTLFGVGRSTYEATPTPQLK